MGGSAFSAILTSAAFPRLPPPVYRALKAGLLPRIAELYTWVGVPHEAPDKKDHGDLDLLVAIPKPPHNSLVPHEIIKEAIGATHLVPMDGNRTSNYAVPIRRGEWASLGHAKDEEEMRSANEDGEIYYQVDVHVCLDKEEWDRIIFFHAYGDMGMILGLIARNNGLALGTKGLKMPNPPNPPFGLSESFDEIASFLGYSLERFHEGFKTNQEVYDWAASSKYFNPRDFRTQRPGITKVKVERTMYAEFVKWVEATRTPTNSLDLPSREERQKQIQQEALVFFNKKEEFETLARDRQNRLRLKEIFSGSRVRDWAELGEHWRGVKLIMDEVRVQMGGEEAILAFLDKNSEDDLKQVVLQVKDKLGIVSLPQDVVDAKGLVGSLARTTLGGDG